MINPEDENHIVLQTSCTRDEAVAMLLGLLQGPVNARPMNDDATPEEWEIINSHAYSLLDDLEERRHKLQGVLAEAEIDKSHIDVITEKREALEKFDALLNKARIYSRHIDDEIARGESSALRVDKRARANSTEIHYTVVSVEQWAKTNPEISILDPFPKGGTENSSTHSEPQQEGGPESHTTKLNNLFTSFAFLVEAFAKTATALKHDDGRPNVSAIATRLEQLAREANKQETLPGQRAQALRKRIDEAMDIKKSKLPKA